MHTIALALELENNSRVTDGLEANSDRYVYDYGYVIVPGSRPNREKILVTLSGLDLGRFDSEGEKYLFDLLNILPGDFISWTLDEEHS